MIFVESQSPLSIANLNDIEGFLSFSLPEDLRDHYLQYNGGHPVPSLFSMGNGEFTSVHEFLPMKYGPPGTLFEDTFIDLVQENPLFPVGMLPIAIDPGGDYFCYSLRPMHFGAIYLYNVEHDDSVDKALLYLAPNLTMFLSALRDGA